jgi:hypothetical protein
VENALSNRIGEAQRILKNLALVYTCHGTRGNPAKLKLAMLTGYFDESGTAPADKLCVVAGFIGNEAQWGAFAHDWIPALGHHRKNLHMTKLRWNRRYNKIVGDLARLGPIPNHYNLTPVRIGIWHQDFEDLLKGKVNETFANPYLICALCCIGAVVDEVLGPDDEIMFIFDRQEGRRAQAMDVLHEIVFKIAKMDHRVKDIDFRPRETTVCLDPADYYAYGYREYQIDPGSPRAKACLPIADSENKVHGGILSREQVQDIADHYREHGMVPGSNWRKMSDQLIEALLKAGWSQHGIAKLKEYVEEHNKKGAWQ